MLKILIYLNYDFVELGYGYNGNLQFNEIVQKYKIDLLNFIWVGNGFMGFLFIYIFMN